MTVIDFSGKIHPYIEDLPIFEDKVDEIAESIDEVGLLHPITLDSEGRVIGGRHRLTACEVAGIDPMFEVWEGDPLSFMLHDNDARKHQTTGQLVAEKALTLASADRRQNGRWQYGEIESYTGVKSGGSLSVRLSEAGVILDYLGREVLEEIARGGATLKEQFEEARREKERVENLERERMELAERQQREEEAARQFFTTNNAAGLWLAERPNQHKTLYAAFKQYEAENEEVRLEEERKRREDDRRQREHLDSLKRDANRLKGFLTGYGQAWGMRDHPDRDRVLNLLDPAERKRFITIEGELTWPATKH